MAITQVGNTYHFYYNRDTKKMYGTDETTDFVAKYYNEELTEEEKGNITQYDEYVNRCMDLVTGKGLSKICCKEDMVSDGSTYGEDAVVELNFFVAEYNRVEAYKEDDLRCNVNFGDRITDNDSRNMIDSTNEYINKEKRPYNPRENSGTIVPGDMFIIDGWRLIVTNRDVKVFNPRGREDHTNVYMANIAMGLDFFIRFTNGQMDALMLNKEDMYFIKGILKSKGFDTSREMKINGLSFTIENDRLNDMGNETGLARNVYNAMRRRGTALNKLTRNEIQELRDTGGLAPDGEIIEKNLTPEQYKRLFVDEYKEIV